MELGTVLVGVGILLALLDAILGAPNGSGRPHWLLAAGVILIGLGVLLGTGDPLITSD